MRSRCVGLCSGVLLPPRAPSQPSTDPHPYGRYCKTVGANGDCTDVSNLFLVSSEHGYDCRNKNNVECNAEVELKGVALGRIGPIQSTE